MTYRQLLVWDEYRFRRRNEATPERIALAKIQHEVRFNPPHRKYQRFQYSSYSVVFERIFKGEKASQDEIKNRVKTSKLGWQAVAGRHLKPYPKDGTAPPPNPFEGQTLAPRK